ncbi:MAG: 3-hydroxyacyl-ACP dehydratase [Flavitalea sp.]
MLVEDIKTLIPQREPFIMIDHLLYCEGDDTRTSFVVKEDNLFLKDSLLQEPALVENIAQSAAARAGYIAVQENRPVAIGYIGAIQNLEIHALPAMGDTIHTEIKVLNQVFNVTLVSGKISCEGKLLAGCELKIFITNQS